MKSKKECKMKLVKIGLVGLVALTITGCNLGQDGDEIIINTCNKNRVDCDRCITNCDKVCEREEYEVKEPQCEPVYNPKARVEHHTYDDCGCDPDLRGVSFYINYWVDTKSIPQSKIVKAYVESDKNIRVYNPKTKRVIKTNSKRVEVSKHDATILFEEKPNRVMLYLSTKDREYAIDLMKENRY